MKNKKLTGQQIKLIINMLSLAIFAYSYLYIYTGFVNKTDAAYQQIDTVKRQIKETEDKIAKEDTVKKELADINAQIQAMIDQYPVDIKKVDNMMFVEQMEKDLDMQFTSVDTTDCSFYKNTTLPIRDAEGNEITQPEAETSDSTAAVNNSPVQANGASDTDGQSDSLSEAEAALGDNSGLGSADPSAETADPTTMAGLSSAITMNFQTNPDGFIKLVDYIKNYPDKTIIDSISVNVDSTLNSLTGTMVLKRFALSGTGKEYEEPKEIDSISIGTDNLFGIDPKDKEDQSSSEDTDSTDDSAEDGQSGTTEETP